MNTNNKIIVTVIVIAVITGIVYIFYVQPQTTQAPSASVAENIPNQSVVANESTTNSLISTTVTYDGASFSPASVTIKQGGTVNFIDKSGNQMWIASNPHPAHAGYDGTNRETHCATGYAGPKPFDECSLGTNFSFVFNKIGSWSYHDHLNGNASGTVVVVE